MKSKLLVVLVTLPVAVLTHFLAAGWTLLGACAVRDTATTVPAPASTQGRICDAQDHWLNVVPLVVLPLGVVLSVWLALRLLSTRWRWIGLTACLWMPLMVAAALASPDDDCTARQIATEPASACSRTGNG